MDKLNKKPIDLNYMKKPFSPKSYGFFCTYPTVLQSPLIKSDFLGAKPIISIGSFCISASIDTIMSPVA